MSDDDIKPLKRKPTEKQLAALRAGRLNPKRAEGRPTKRAGPAYRREVRKQAREDSLKAQEARRAARLAAGTNLEPPPVPDLPTYSTEGQKYARKAADPGSYVIDPPPAIDGITAAELSGLLPAEPPDDPNRPRIRYSRMLADAICERIAQGEPIQAICAIDGMPSAQQVLTWARTKPEFKALYEEARTLQADYLADRMLGLAQRALDDPKDAAAVRVAADILAKQAEWRAPRKFGPRMDLTVTAEQKTPDQIRAEAKSLQEELGIPEEKRIH